ncbi:creatininase family protein [Chloroflexota bacterium]
MEIHLANLTWPDIEEIQKKPNAVILPVGSVEQHGPHLPLSVDYRCPAYVAELAASKVNRENDIRVLVAPPLQYGTIASTFGGFPGCIGVSPDTAVKVFEDIARGFINSYFTNIIFLNGHFTNVVPLFMALQKVSLEFPGVGLYGIRWLHLGSDIIPNIRKSEWGLHADELETSATLFIQPENVHMEKAIKDFPGFSLSERWVRMDICGDKSKVFFHSRERFPSKAKGSSGVMGDPTVASKETGEKILNASADDLARIIVEIVASENTAGK